MSWHASDGFVYHVREDCNIAQQVAPGDRLSGTGDKPHCGRCADLIRAEMPTADARRAVLAQEIAGRSRRGRRVESQSDFQAILVFGQRVNHILHLLLAAFTAGLWCLVWIFLNANGERRELVQVNEWGRVTVTEL